MTTQKQIFLSTEGDQWFVRNQKYLLHDKNYDLDWVVQSWGCLGEIGLEPKVLEVGCSAGLRLQYLAKTYGINCYGVEPSGMACDFACKQGVNVSQGTADNLPFEMGLFDVVILGFCLYLCDRKDLFQIAAEVDRVLKPQAWLLIEDFYAPNPSENAYHHREGVKSFKMDYREMFLWNPAYECFQHSVIGHGSNSFVDDPREWVSRSIIRKNQCLN